MEAVAGRETPQEFIPPEGSQQVGQININGQIRPLYILVTGTQTPTDLSNIAQRVTHLFQAVVSAHNIAHTFSIDRASQKGLHLSKDGREFTSQHNTHDKLAAWTAFENAVLGRGEGARAQPSLASPMMPTSKHHSHMQVRQVASSPVLQAGRPPSRSASRGDESEGEENFASPLLAVVNPGSGQQRRRADATHVRGLGRVDEALRGANRGHKRSHSAIAASIQRQRQLSDTQRLALTSARVSTERAGSPHQADSLTSHPRPSITAHPDTLAHFTRGGIAELPGDLSQDDQ